MKKIIYIGMMIVSSLAGIMFGLLHNTQNDVGDANRIYAQTIIAYEGFDSVLEDADVIVEGKIESIIVYPSYDEYLVTVSETEKGETTEQIVIRNYLYEYSYKYGKQEINGKTNTNYKVGESYIFVLQHIRNVYEDIYMIFANVYIPLDNVQESTVLTQKIDDSLGYIKQYEFHNEVGRGQELCSNYIESSDTGTIFEGSEYVVHAQIGDLYRSTENVDIYSCKVLGVLKGELRVFADDQIIVPFFKETVEVGGDYVICLNSDRSDAVIYTLSSKNSVWKPSELENLLETDRR